MNPEVVKQLLLLFVLMAIGFIGTKIKLIDKVGSDKISALISRVTMPAMYLSTFMAQPFSTSSLKRIGTLFAISAGYYALATAIGFLYVKVTRADEKSRGVYQFMMIFSNAAYMGSRFCARFWAKKRSFLPRSITCRSISSPTRWASGFSTAAARIWPSTKRKCF